MNVGMDEKVGIKVESEVHAWAYGYRLVNKNSMVLEKSSC